MSEKSRLINKLVTNKTTRQAYIRSKVSTSVASQIRALRRRRAHMTQQALAREVEMRQSRISAMERPGTRFNIETLVRLASAFKVGLVVKFTSFSEMLKWENAFSQDAFNVQTIDKDSDFSGVTGELSEEESTRAIVAELLGGTFNSPRESGMGNVNLDQNNLSGRPLYGTFSGNASQSGWIY